MDGTVPRLSTSDLVYNEEDFEGSFRSASSRQSLVYQDFRTPAVLAANGPEHCNAEAEEDGSKCLYRFDFPHAYYVRVGTGIGQTQGDYGTMQFRISRASDQSPTGMTTLKETEGRKPSGQELDSLPPDNANGDTVTLLDADGTTTTESEIHFAGDVDWFSFYMTSASQCDFTTAGREVDGNTASGLRIRVFDPPDVMLKAPSRGSLRSSVSNYREPGLNILEITGSRAGGYTITTECSPPPTPPPTLVAEVDDGRSRPQFNYDDYRTSFEWHGANPLPRAEPLAYGQIDITSSRSRTGDGAHEYYGDSDSFRVLTDGESRVRVVLTARSATVPAHTFGTTDVVSTTLSKLDLTKASIQAKTCRSDGGVEPGTEPEQDTSIRVSFSPSTPRVGVALTATFHAPGGVITAGPTWQWSRADSASGPFTDISGAESATYTPVAGDDEKYLRARATYQKFPFISNRTLDKVAEYPVQTSEHTSPLFRFGNETVWVLEHSAAGTVVGVTSAFDDDGDTLVYTLSGRDTAAFNEDFSLNSSTGVITVKTGGTVDYDYRTSYRITLTVTDGEDSSGNSESAATIDDRLPVTIRVTNVKEIIPSHTGVEVPPVPPVVKPVSLLVDNQECFFVTVLGGFGLGNQSSVGGYRLTVTDEGTPPHPAKDDEHSPLMFDSEGAFLLKPFQPGLKAFITRDSHTHDGTTYTPSTRIGRIPGDGRLDDYNDEDLFKSRLQAGKKYYVIVRAGEGDAADSKPPARDSANSKVHPAFLVLDSSGEQVSLLEPSGSAGHDIASSVVICATLETVAEDEQEFVCRNTAYATVEVEQTGDYFVGVHLRNTPVTGDYSVEIPEVRSPVLTGLQSVAESGPSHNTLAVRATVSNPRGAYVHFQLKKATDTEWPDTHKSLRTSTHIDDRFNPSEELSYSWSQLEPNTSYNARVSLTSDFSSGVRTITVRTTRPPAITRVAQSQVTYLSANITVSISNLYFETVHLWHKSAGATGWGAATTMNATIDDPSPVFELTGLDTDTSYEVRARLTNSLPDTNSLTFRTLTAPAITRVTRSQVTHDSANITVSVSNALDETVQIWWREAAHPGWGNSTTWTATKADPSPVFKLTGLEPYTPYEVRASLTSSLPDTNSVTFTTSAAP